MAQRIRAMQQEPVKEDGRPHDLIVIGKNVRALRRRKIPDMSQGRLAELAGVAENTIGRLERIGVVGALPTEPWSPNYEKLRRIAAALDVPTERLLEWPTPSYLSGKHGGRRAELTQTDHTQLPLMVAVR